MPTLPPFTFSSDPSAPDCEVTNELLRMMSTLLLGLYSNLESSVSSLGVGLENPHQVIWIRTFSEWGPSGVDVLWQDKVTGSVLQRDFQSEEGMAEWVSFCQDMIGRRRAVQAGLPGWGLKFKEDTAEVVGLETVDLGEIARIVGGAR